jgi:bis(5'-adenosyl)-triphosphatase
LQDGAAAGQSVPHVHVHIIPRTAADFGGNNDSVYSAVERHEAYLGSLHAVTDGNDATLNGHGAARHHTGFRAPPDEERIPRTDEEMEKEALWLAGLFP